MLLEEEPLGRPYKVKGKCPEPRACLGEARGPCACTWAEPGTCPGSSAPRGLSLALKARSKATLPIGWALGDQAVPSGPLGTGDAQAGPGGSVWGPGRQQQCSLSQSPHPTDRNLVRLLPLAWPESSCRRHRDFRPADADALISLDLWPSLWLYYRDKDEAHHCQTPLGSAACPTDKHRCGLFL